MEDAWGESGGRYLNLNKVDILLRTLMVVDWSSMVLVGSGRRDADIWGEEMGGGVFVNTIPFYGRTR